MKDFLPHPTDLDQERWPKNPYCSNDPRRYGVRIRKFESARKHRLIQPNPPGIVFRMVFDIDIPRQPEPFFAYELAGLAPPNWISQNPKNKHCHLSYEIGTPISLTEGSRSRRYLAAIETIYGSALKADSAYSGNLIKNPSHFFWKTYQLRKDPYSLDELSDWIDLSQRLPAIKVDENTFFLGRNCAVFEVARKEAYKLVREYWKAGGYEAFRKTVIRLVEGVWDSIKAHDSWIEKTHPYRFHEIQNTADSIARWTWQNFSPKSFFQIQVNRGKRSGLSRKEKSDENWFQIVYDASQSFPFIPESSNHV